MGIGKYNPSDVGQYNETSFKTGSGVDPVYLDIRQNRLITAKHREGREIARIAAVEQDSSTYKCIAEALRRQLECPDMRNQEALVAMMEHGDIRRLERGLCLAIVCTPEHTARTGEIGFLSLPIIDIKKE